MHKNTQQRSEKRRCVSIHGGIHDGAESQLGRQQITIIGSAMDCDLRLADVGIAAHHVAIGVSGERLVVRPMDGQCSVNGKRLRAGQSVAIACGDRIVLLDTDVWLTTTEQPDVDNAADGGNPQRCEVKSARRWPWTLSAGVLLIAIVAGFGSQPLLSKDVPMPDAMTSVNAVLETLDITSDVTLSKDAGVVTLRGVLPDDIFAKLERSLQSLPRDVVNRTQSVSRLLELVRSVFRTNGYHANLTYVGDASVQVSNLDGDNQKIQQIAAHARDDVAVLASLTFAPVSDSKRSDKRLAIYSTDPDKRLTTIVDGDTAYVATTDGGRYFVGSVLPGGLVLRDISADGIHVDDNGEFHWLAL